MVDQDIPQIDGLAVNKAFYIERAAVAVLADGTVVIQHNAVKDLILITVVRSTRLTELANLLLAT